MNNVKIFLLFILFSKGDDLMKIQWDTDLETGIKKIDERHKEIIRRINILSNLTDDEKEKEIDRALRFLGGYVIDCFKEEEKHMIQYKYSDYDFHKEQHAQFLIDLSLLKRHYEKEGGITFLVMTTFYRVVDWLKNHITNVHKEMTEPVRHRHN